MKALRVYGPCTVRIEDIPITEPKDDEVVVRVRAVGICGSDIDLYRNDSAHIKDGRTKLPIITGHEWSGEITKLGKEVKEFKVGDKVTGECSLNCGRCEYCISGRYNLCENLAETGIFKREGAFAEYITFPASHLHKFNDLSFQEAALIEPLTVSLYAVARTKPYPADTILVTGPGPIGLQAAQILKRVFGVKKVILSGTRDERLKLGLALGVDEVINVRKEDLGKRISEITDNHMVDRVIETSGAGNIFSQLKGVVRPGGVITLVGFFGSQNVPIDWDDFILNEISIISANGSPGNWEDAIEMVESGRVEINPIISHVLGLEDFEKAIELITEKKENACKIVIEP